MPQWIDYLADGSPLAERGVTPQMPFAGGPEAFWGSYGVSRHKDQEAIADFQTLEPRQERGNIRGVEDILV